MMRILLASLLAMMMVLTSVDAQDIVAFKSYADHRTSTITSVAELNDTLYASSYQGTVFLLDDKLNYLRKCEELMRYRIEEVFEYRSMMWALTTDFLLLYRSHDGSWVECAELTGYPYRDSSNSLYAVENGQIVLIETLGSAPVKHIRGLIGFNPGTVRSIAVVNDTVLIGYRSSNTLAIQLMDGTPIALDTSAWKYVFRMYGLSDGSVLFHKGNSAFILKSNSISTLGFTPPRIGYQLIHFDSPSVVVVNGKVGVAGNSTIDNAYTYDTLSAYFMLGLDQPIQKIEAFGEYFGYWSCVSRIDDAFILTSEKSSFTIAEDLGTIVRKEYLPGIKSASNFYPLHPSRSEPVGFVRLEYPDSVVNSRIGTPTEDFADYFPDLYPKPGIFRSLFEWEDGSICAGFDYAMMYKRHPDSSWQKTFRFQHGEGDQTSYCDRFDGRTLVAHDSVKHIAVSKDGGASWKRSFVKSIRLRAGIPFAYKDEVFLFDGDKLIHFEYSSMGDTVVGDTMRIYGGTEQKFLDADDESVRFILSRSYTDPTWSPEYIDHFVVYKWFPASRRLDSAEVSLSAPFHHWNTSELFACVYNDTIMVWCNEVARFMRIHNNTVVLDKHIDTKRNRSLNLITPVSSFLESNGTWWINYGHDLSIAFDVRYKPDSVTDVRGQEISEPMSARLFPNPGSGQITIALDNSDAVEWHIELVDVCGRVVDAVRTNSYNNELKITFIQQPQGVYFVKLMDGRHRPVSLMYYFD